MLATEDELSEAIGCRLIEDSRFAGSSLRKLRRDGAGYLYSGMDKWRQVAARQPVLIITDLDDRHCPLALLEDWRGTRGVLPDNLLLRVAVREIESWVMADHEGMRSLIGNKGKLPPEPDLLPDPKSHLLKLAEYAPRAIRVDLVIKKGAQGKPGIGIQRTPDGVGEDSVVTRKGCTAFAQSGAGTQGAGPALRMMVPRRSLGVGASQARDWLKQGGDDHYEAADSEGACRCGF